MVRCCCSQSWLVLTPGSPTGCQSLHSGVRDSAGALCVLLGWWTGSCWCLEDGSTHEESVSRLQQWGGQKGHCKLVKSWGQSGECHADHCCYFKIVWPDTQASWFEVFRILLLRIDNWYWTFTVKVLISKWPWQCLKTLMASTCTQHTIWGRWTAEGSAEEEPARLRTARTAAHPLLGAPLSKMERPVYSDTKEFIGWQAPPIDMS